MSVGSLTLRGARCVLVALVMLACARTGWAAGQQYTPGTGETYGVRAPEQPPVLLYWPEAPSARPTEPDSGVSWRDDHGGPLIPASIRVFYPTRGQSDSGACWLGLEIDSGGTLYPSNGSGVYRLLPDGTLVNGVDDTDLFILGPSGTPAVLEESAGRFFGYLGDTLLDAPFVEGSTFSPLLSGLAPDLVSIEVGRGALAGSLFAVHASVPRLTRVTLSPLGSSIFAEGSLFDAPSAMASAPDGTLYVVTHRSSLLRPLLVRVGTDGAVSVFAEGTDAQVNGAVAVDAGGNVYWSRAEGMAVYDPRGRLLGLLPGPPDKPAFGNLLGAEFDAAGNLYVLENFGCKRIYQYSFEPGTELTVSIDIKPGHDPNTFEPRHGKLKVAILSSDVFDATQVEPRTVRFGATGAEAKPTCTSHKDVNGDGRRDKVLEFKVHQTGLTCASTSAVLTGRTKTGVTFRGTDAVKPKGCDR